MGNPRISVVIPFYNCTDFLEEAIRSIHRQTLSVHEILLIDDGSDAPVTLACLEADTNGAVRVIRTEHKGVSHARNTGVREARGEYIAFLDADDTWLPHKLAAQIPILETGDRFSLVYSDAKFVSPSGHDLKRTIKSLHPLRLFPQGRILDRLVCGNFITLSTVVVRKSAFLASGGFDETLSRGEDWDLWLRMASETEMYGIDAALIQYRRHPRSITDSRPAQYDQLRSIIERGFARLDSSLHNKRRQRAVLASYAFSDGVQYLRKGNRAAARHFFAASLGLQWWNLAPMAGWCISSILPGACFRLAEKIYTRKRWK